VQSVYAIAAVAEREYPSDHWFHRRCHGQYLFAANSCHVTRWNCDEFAGRHDGASRTRSFDIVGDTVWRGQDVHAYAADYGVKVVLYLGYSWSGLIYWGINELKVFIHISEGVRERSDRPPRLTVVR
jgi:hypothetical protein